MNRAESDLLQKITQILEKKGWQMVPCYALSSEIYRLQGPSEPAKVILPRKNFRFFGHEILSIYGKKEKRRLRQGNALYFEKFEVLRGDRIRIYGENSAILPLQVFVAALGTLSSYEG